MDKIETDGKNKTLCRCCFNYTLLKIIVDNRLEDLWRRENADFSEFTCFDRSSAETSRIYRVYTDIQISKDTKINNIMVSFMDHYNVFFIDRFSSKTKIKKHSWYFNNSVL